MSVVPPGGGPAPARLAPLDALRGLAIAMVVVSHIVGERLPAAGLDLGNNGLGTAGVLLFFLLSGYLIQGNLERQPLPVFCRAVCSIPWWRRCSVDSACWPGRSGWRCTGGSRSRWSARESGWKARCDRREDGFPINSRCHERSTLTTGWTATDHLKMMGWALQTNIACALLEIFFFFEHTFMPPLCSWGC